MTELFLVPAPLQEVLDNVYKWTSQKANSLIGRYFCASGNCFSSIPTEGALTGTKLCPILLQRQGNQLLKKIRAQSSRFSVYIKKTIFISYDWFLKTSFDHIILANEVHCWTLGLLKASPHRLLLWLGSAFLLACSEPLLGKGLHSFHLSRGRASSS